jgi:hypothetical protein
MLNEAWIRSTYILHQRYKNLCLWVSEESNSKKSQGTFKCKQFIKECLEFNCYNSDFRVWIKTSESISKYQDFGRIRELC